ncbi:MAG: DUF2075 domain-containing protein [Planctomycetota bacterium]
MGSAASPAKPSAWYAASIADFQAASTNEVIGALTRAGSLPVEEQRLAWEGGVGILRTALTGLDGFLWLEFEVPRLATRIDAVVIVGPVIVPIEFKVGAKDHTRADFDQAWDYALDLKNFHRGSHGSPIFPVLVATEAVHTEVGWSDPHPDGVHPPRRCNPDGLRRAIDDAIARGRGPRLDAGWGTEPYQPTPTIVQAARALYARHSVEAISRSDASAKNLGTTSQIVEQIIRDAQRESWKALVLVTGVPGAGKTLVGLNIATRHRRSIEEDPAHAVFLSGNDPLVKVLRAALTRDEYARLRQEGKPRRKGAIEQEVKPFIQNVHHFRDEGLRSQAAPPEHVVVFDEAQRAWNQRKTARFMKTRKNIADFAMSEPEFQLAYMDRFADWAVAVCLVGGGQEIHDGEAGIQAWIDAARLRFPHWRVFVSPRLHDSEYGAGQAIAALRDRPHVTRHDDLHLAVSMRSFRAEDLSGFVKAVLDQDDAGARRLYEELRPRYPLVVTRDLQRAKDWVRAHARGTERFGLVASSQAERLKPHAIDVRAPINPVHWFLHDRDDTRSSFYLEDAATEFQVQGLELDWVCATWDADLRMSKRRWLHRKFHGSQWKRVHSAEHQRYLVNAYRVLLTRARQGMAIFVPPGDKNDPTRLPEFYDETFGYLASLGVEQA